MTEIHQGGSLRLLGNAYLIASKVGVTCTKMKSSPRSRKDVRFREVLAMYYCNTAEQLTNKSR